MAKGHFDPLPLGGGLEPIRRAKFLDVEVFGHISAESGSFDSITITNATLTNVAITGGTIDTITITNLTIGDDLVVGDDMYSANWDGTVPLSLPDSGATVGWALDGGNDVAQFQSIYAEGGDLGTLRS